jgi:hypothetical protein
MNENIFSCNRYVAVLLSVLILAFACLPQANAQSTWNNEGGDYLWSNGSNWSGGIPAATGTVFFDGSGTGSPIIVTSQTVKVLQFGQASQISGASIAGYTLDSGTLSFAMGSSSLGAGFLNYYGSANTADQTINSNIVLEGGAGTGQYTVVNLSGGNIVIGGNISVVGSVNPNFHLGILNVAGNYGNLVLKGNTIGAGNAVSLTMRFFVNGDTGALVFNNSTGINLLGTTSSEALNLAKTHASQAAPHVEFASGNNIVQGSSAITTSSTGNYYIKVDTGASVAVDHINNKIGSGDQAINLYGGGNGVVYGRMFANAAAAANTMALVKDGTGIWALTGNGAAYGQAYSTYGGGSTICNGILLVSGSGSSGTGAVVVDPIDSADADAAPILGGRGTILGAVSVKDGGSIAPGGTAAGGATTLAVVSTPLGNVGTLTLSSSLTAELGATFSFDLDSDGYFDGNLGTSDQLLVAGALNLGSATLSLNDVGSTILTVGDYFTLISYSSTLNGTFNGLDQGAVVSVGANQYTIDYGIGHVNQITLDLIPEPSTWVLLLGGSGLLLVLRGFRRQDKSDKA